MFIPKPEKVLAFWPISLHKLQLSLRTGRSSNAGNSSGLRTATDTAPGMPRVGDMLEVSGNCLVNSCIRCYCYPEF